MQLLAIAHAAKVKLTLTTSRASANACACSPTDGSAAAATAYVVGTIVLVKNGDHITLAVPAKELKKRRQAWKKPAPRYSRGVLAKYAHTVTSASLGAVTDADLKL